MKENTKGREMTTAEEDSQGRRGEGAQSVLLMNSTREMTDVSMKWRVVSGRRKD